jgi:hypothetical protein
MLGPNFTGESPGPKQEGVGRQNAKDLTPQLP